MKRFLIILAAIASMSSVSSAAESLWMTDFTAALERSKKENKPILMNFTGSDWCGWCVKLSQEVFNTKVFKAYAEKNLILMEVDFPQNKPQSAKLRAQNEGLKQALNVEGFPTLFLVNSKLEVITPTLGYYPGGPKVWTDGLDAFVKAKK